jgi:SpoIID/LytB domain protein
VRKRIILVIAVAMMLPLPVVSASAAESESSIEFQGAGFGHGVGMSQWGAYGRAVDGQTYTEILEAYYTDASVVGFGGGTPDPGPILTNVGSDRTFTTITVLDGPATPRNGVAITRMTGEAEPPTATLFTDDTLAITDATPDAGNPDGCVMTVSIFDAEAVAFVETIWDEGTCDVSVALTSGGEPEHLISATNCRRTADCTYGYGTALHVVDNGSDQRLRSDCIGGCTFGLVYPGFDLVVETTLDEYVRGIAEVPYLWPAEALKAQAVAARSYAASYIIAVDPTSAGCFCDVRNSTANQVYAGWLGDRLYSERWIQAANDTAGEVVKHAAAPDAGIVRAYYGSSNGGASESSEVKWGTYRPYLVSVPDHYSLVEENGLASWTKGATSSEVIASIWGTSAEFAAYRLSAAEVTATNDSGSAKTVLFTAKKPDGSLVEKEASSATVTNAFDLYSWYFSVDDDAIDNVAPVISLIGTDPTEVLAGPPYVDDGATALDDVNGDITADIVVGGLPIDTSTPGTYTVTYDVADSGGNAAAQVTRNVVVVEPDPGGSFTDDDDSIFEQDIEWLAAEGITQGCGVDLYCPDGLVTRGQMAAFLRRALEELITVDPDDALVFTDTADSLFDSDIAWLSAAGITRGCGPNTYCPENPVTRGQMAAFLKRAFVNLIPAPTPHDHGFTDTGGHSFEADIQWLVDTGITTGCTADSFCPDSAATRGQMAAFIHRAFVAAELD